MTPFNICPLSVASDMKDGLHEESRSSRVIKLKTASTQLIDDNWLYSAKNSSYATSLWTLNILSAVSRWVILGSKWTFCSQFVLDT